MCIMFENPLQALFRPQGVGGGGGGGARQRNSLYQKDGG